MSLEWNSYTIGESCNLITGFPFKSKYYLENGAYNVVRGDNVKEGFIQWGDKKRCWDSLNDKLKKVILKDKDIVIGMDGSKLGKNRATISKKDLPALLAQRVACVRAKEGFDQDYIKYVILSNYFKAYVDKVKTGTSIPHISLGQISEFTFEAPDYKKQKIISAILSNIDKKISVNQEINKNLLQLSKVIFKNWFVEFEPFGGVQPNNWKICTLEDVCDLKAGGDKPDVVSDEITDTCSYPIYSNGLDKDGLYGYTDQAKIFEESVTVSARGTIGFVCLRHIPYVPIVRLVSVIPKKEFISAKYLYLFLDRLNIMGTGTTQQQLTIPDFKKTEILVPTLDIIKSFTNYITPIFEKIWIQEEEIKKLQKLRDTLLPKLMSGEIDVSKINCDLKNFIKRFIKKFKSIF